MHIPEQGPEFSELKKETLGCLHLWHEVIAGKAKAPLPDPFWARNDKLSIEVQDAVITGVLEFIESDYTKFRNYHLGANGLPGNSPLKLKPPKYAEMPREHKFTMVQMLDKIYQKYKVEAPAPVPVPEPQPYYWC